SNAVALLHLIVRDGRHLFPPSPALLETLACLAIGHLERFEFRLRLHDLDEAARYCAQVEHLAPVAGRLDVRVWTMMRLVPARVDQWYFRVDGDLDRLEHAIEVANSVVQKTGDILAIAQLATCLRLRVPYGETPVADLDEAGKLWHLLLSKDIPPLHVQHWFD